MVPASARYITEAWNLIDQMDADMGGTEMERALDAVFGLKGEETAGTVLLITDGEIQEHQKLVSRAEQSGHRIFVVGVGTSVAETFLRNLANATGGACELVAPQEGMSEFVLLQFHRMRQKRVGKIRIEWPTTHQWETPLPETVFAGDTVHVFAGFDQSTTGETRLIVEGGDAVVTAITPMNNFEIPRIAAARRLDEISHTIADMASGNLARDLALRYQLLSPWTNFLVIAERADKAEELPELQKVPQMLAAGWGGAGSVVLKTNVSQTNDRRSRVVMCMGMRAPLRSPTNSVDDLFSVATQGNSRAQAMSDTGMDKYDIPAFLRKQADGPSDVSPATRRSTVAGVFDVTRERIRQIEAKVLRKLSTPTRSEKLRSHLDSLVAPDTPVAFIGYMEVLLSGNLRTPILPESLADLARSGLDANIVRGLSVIIAKGYDEIHVVAAFIHALTQSVVGDSFGRVYKRAILKVWKQVSPDPALDRVMQEALTDISAEAWNWRQGPIEQFKETQSEPA